jgi:hypothetical protein
MISSWLLHMWLCFTSLWYIPDYCTCTFVSLVWYLPDYRYCPCAFVSLVWYLPDYCIFTFASVCDIFLISVHVPLLHLSMISSWLLYIYHCFTSLWYIPDYCTCTFASPVYNISLLLYMYLCFSCLLIIIPIHLLYLSISIYSSTETFKCNWCCNVWSWNSTGYMATTVTKTRNYNLYSQSVWRKRSENYICLQGRL